jgi:hypothetical protein
MGEGRDEMTATTRGTARYGRSRRESRLYSSTVSTSTRTRADTPLRPFELRLRLPNGAAAVVVMDARNIGEALDKARNALGDVQVIEPS